jgi:hypothetical protein
MDPEDGCLWIYGNGDEQTLAFTSAGMEYFRQLLAETQTQSAIPAVLSGGLLSKRQAGELLANSRSLCGARGGAE